MVIDIANYINGSFDTFPLPETLTNVTLHIHSSGDASFNFSRILRQCPLLETLSIETIMRDHIYLTWDEPMTPHRDFALRSLTLNQVILQHTELKRILSSAPRLKVLKLIGMTSSGLDLTLLCSHIKTLSLDLETFHFSAYDKILTEDLQQQTLEICPVTSEWNLWASDMSPLLLKKLEVHTPCLTTLELHWQRKGNVTAFEGYRDDIVTASRLLFEYLCNSPSATNLRSLKTGVLYRNMDVFGRGQSFDTSYSPALQAPSTSSGPGIWRCRNLRVLHINLRDPMSSMKRRIQSRIVFGYIARVAPHLEDLEIYFPYFIVNKAPEHIYAARLCMQLEGGFCLLGRLRCLRRLKVYAAGGGITKLCREMDLNWIVPYGRSDKFKELRQQTIASWQSLRLVEDQCEKARQQQQDDGDGSGDNRCSLDAEVRGQFRNLGLLLDIEETINEIDGGSLVPFPSLTGLSFIHPILLRPEKALNSCSQSPSVDWAFGNYSNKNSIRCACAVFCLFCLLLLPRQFLFVPSLSPFIPLYSVPFPFSESLPTIPCAMLRILYHRIKRTSPSTTLAATSPLEIPLILDLIFSYLDTYTIRHSVAPVCRQWFFHNQNRLYRTIDSGDDWTRAQARRFSQRLLGAGRLECMLTLDSITLSKNQTYNIRNILDRYWKEYQKQLERRNRKVISKRKPALYDFIPLRSIRMRIQVQYNTTTDSIPFPPSLTSLEMVLAYTNQKTEDLSKIMRMCPLLENLSFEVEQRPGQAVLWGTSLDQEQQPTPLPLRHLNFRNISVEQSSLENLLSFTPRLETLTLMALDTAPHPAYDWTRLLEHLKALGITLTSVHFSEFEHQSHLEILPRLGEICHDITHWCLWCLDVTPSFLQELTVRTSFVTTLELFWRPRSRSGIYLYGERDINNAPRLIHKFLCTSSLLVHLRTLKTVIRAKYFDLFNRRNRGVGFDPREQPPTPPVIWKCRNLETLYIDVHGPGESRILFGYISRVLPRLVDLLIYMPEMFMNNQDFSLRRPAICVNLKGGFCLLSRLRHLQTLRVIDQDFYFPVFFACSKADLTWILPSGRKEKYKRARQIEMATWREMGGQEDVLEATQPSSSLLRPTALSEVDAAIWSQLRHLGLLLDVEEMVKEIDSGDYEPFPSLQRIALTDYRPPALRRVKEELDRIFAAKFYFRSPIVTL